MMFSLSTLFFLPNPPFYFEFYSNPCMPHAFINKSCILCRTARIFPRRFFGRICWALVMGLEYNKTSCSPTCQLVSCFHDKFLLWIFFFLAVLHKFFQGLFIFEMCFSCFILLETTWMMTCKMTFIKNTVLHKFLLFAYIAY